MKRLVLSLTAILFFAGGSWAQSGDTVDVCKDLNKKAAALASRYKELRDKRRRVPQGTFDRDLDHFNGQLHEVLTSLGVELGHPPFTKETLVKCLGAPDAIKSGGQMNMFLGVYQRELKKAGRTLSEKSDREYLIYFWRGWHDFIFFISEGGVIVDHGWWFAYE
jgi:hypothetical protein